MNTFGLTLCLALLVGVAVADDCCTKNCDATCEATRAVCLDIPILVDCGMIKQKCVGLCGGICSCSTGCQAKCNAARKACDTESAGSLLPICQTSQGVCMSQCAATCQAKTVHNTLTRAIAPVIGAVTKSLQPLLGLIMPKAPAA